MIERRRLFSLLGLPFVPRETRTTPHVLGTIEQRLEALEEYTQRYCPKCGNAMYHSKQVFRDGSREVTWTCRPYSFIGEWDSVHREPFSITQRFAPRPR